MSDSPSSCPLDLQSMTVRPISPDETCRWNALMQEHHYLGFVVSSGRRSSMSLSPVPPGWPFWGGEPPPSNVPTGIALLAGFRPSTFAGCASLRTTSVFSFFLRRPAPPIWRLAYWDSVCAACRLTGSRSTITRFFWPRPSWTPPGLPEPVTKRPGGSVWARPEGLDEMAGSTMRMVARKPSGSVRFTPGRARFWPPLLMTLF